jgi:hypothetical protein
MGFLDLPAELRNVIYEQVLEHKSPIEIRHRHVYEIHFAYCRAMTQVNRRIRAECLSIYYMSNTFLLLSLDNCIAWLKVIGDDCRHLQHLRLGEGVLEGVGWATKRNDQHHRVKVSCRLSTPGGPNPELSALVTDGVVEDEMKAKAEARLKAIKHVIKGRGPLDIEISSSVYHCKHCAYGVCAWCRHSRCCHRDWNNSD